MLTSLGTLSFSSPTYAQNENGGFAIIPVVRQGGSVGTLSATFNASTGLNATAGVDFVATNGTLTFGPGEVSKVFTVPLIDNNHIDVSNRAVVLQLTNPVPAGVLAYPSTALLNIVSDGFNLPPGGGDPNFFAGLQRRRQCRRPAAERRHCRRRRLHRGQFRYPQSPGPPQPRWHARLWFCVPAGRRQ